jgi:dsDNA-specific endonuclease/ATPase MutS2
MDKYSLKKLEFHRVKEMLGRHCATSLGEAHDLQNKDGVPV